jgi:hypothetical protein
LLKKGQSTSGLDYQIKQAKFRLMDNYRSAERGLNGLQQKELDKKRKQLDKLHFKILKTEQQVDKIIAAKQDGDTSPLLDRKAAGNGYSANASVAEEEESKAP